MLSTFPGCIRSLIVVGVVVVGLMGGELVQGLSCESFKADKSSSLPCTEVPRCATSNTMQKYSTVLVTKTTTGSGSGKSTAEVRMCFDEKKLYLDVTLENQFYLTNENQFKNCNDAIFNENVFETFVAPYVEAQSHCYNELDISPNNVMFEAGIYNPNLNHTNIVGTDMNCDKSGITHNTVVGTKAWTASLSFPFSLINCPYECSSPYCGTNSPMDAYRINFYRINELVPVSQCSSSTCEYLAWSPTLTSSPAFHEPTKFGYMLLQR
jgi:hypothetical protein